MDAKELIEKYKAGQLSFVSQNLSGIDLSWETLPGISLCGSDLYGAKLAGTVLTGADLSGGVNLTHADLGRADLTGANLQGADLRGANLRDAILTDAIYDDSTHFPMGFSPESTGTIKFNPNRPAEPSPSTESPNTPIAQSLKGLADIAPTQVGSPVSGAASAPTTPPVSAPTFDSSSRTVSASASQTAYATQPPTILSKPSQEWLKPAIIGGTVGALVILAGLSIFRVPSRPISQAPTNTTEAQPEFNTLSSANLSESDATDLIRNWLKTKRIILAPPFNRQASSDLTTDILLNDLNKSGGSISWLENNNAYYRFGVQRIEQVETFTANDTNATIVMRITEERSLIINGRVDPKQSDFKTRRIRYSLRFVEGKWKIADYQVDG
jgi:uncharacterized protein YjbI with pentapeptide repeats